MYISFYPPLGSHTHVPVIAPQSPLHASFSARLSAPEYDKVLDEGVRIEVWTDAPSDGRLDGEWGPIAFEEIRHPAEQPATQSSEHLELCISADAHAPENLSIGRSHLFRAAFSLPPVPQRVYAFTYRLVYPSGICWLGSDRNNGVLELGDGSVYLEENAKWGMHGKERVFVSNRKSDAEEDLVVGRLVTGFWTWSGWASDGLSVWPIADLSHDDANRRARLILLFPSATDEDAILVPQAHMFRATSWFSPITVSSQGQVVLHSFTGSGTVEHRVHDTSSESDWRLLHSEITSSCHAPEIFGLKNNFSTILFTPNQDSDTSATIYAQPLTASTPRLLSVPIQNLDVFTKSSSVVSLFNYETRNTLFIGPSANTDDIILKCGAFGGNFVVSSVYDLIDDSIPSAKCHISLPSQTVRPEIISDSKKVRNSLPTPPASPVSKPRHTVSFALPPEDDVELASRSLRRGKSMEQPPATTSDKTTDTASPGNGHERMQALTVNGWTRVQMFSVLKMLARLFGVALVRLFLLVFRFLSGTRPDRTLAQGKEDEDRDACASDAIPTSLDSVDEVDSESKPEMVVAAPPIQSRDILSGGDETSSISCKLPGNGHGTQALKWELPAGDAPITLIVRSESGQPKVEMEVDGECVEPSRAVDDVGKKTRVFEVVRPHGACLTLLVRLISCKK